MAMITETRDVRDFDEVVVQGRGELILEQGEVEAVVIEADASVMPHVKAEVEGRRLVLGSSTGGITCCSRPPLLRFRVSAVTVKRVTISGSGTVRAEALRADDLQPGDQWIGRYGVPAVDGWGGLAGHLRRRQDDGLRRSRKRGRAHQRFRQHADRRACDPGGRSAHQRFGQREGLTPPRRSTCRSAAQAP